MESEQIPDNEGAELIPDEPSTAAQDVVDEVHEEVAESAPDPAPPVEDGADPAPPPEGTTSDDQVD